MTDTNSSAGPSGAPPKPLPTPWWSGAPRGSEKVIDFGRHRFLAWLGLMGGILIALFVPLVTLTFGQNLPAWGHLIIIALALLVGGTLSCISVFFGIVIPVAVQKCWD